MSATTLRSLILGSGKVFRIQRAISLKSREKVYALRYRSYRRVGAIECSPSEAFEDKYDHQPNAVLWTMTRNGELIGSIRSMWHDPAQPALSIPEMEGYSADIAAKVPAGMRLLSANRFVIEPQADLPASRLPLLLFRLHIVSLIQNGGYVIAAVKEHHLPFYQRALRLERLSERRVYPGLTASMYLTGCDWQANLAMVLQRTPALRPRGYERILLDPAYRDMWETGLPVEF